MEDLRSEIEKIMSAMNGADTRGIITKNKIRQVARFPLICWTPREIGYRQIGSDGSTQLPTECDQPACE
jgi:hypothetical protein